MKNRQLFLSLTAVGIMAAFFSCSTIPKGAVAVKPFYKEKYTWVNGMRLPGWILNTRKTWTTPLLNIP